MEVKLSAGQIPIVRTRRNRTVSKSNALMQQVGAGLSEGSVFIMIKVTSRLIGSNPCKENRQEQDYQQVRRLQHTQVETEMSVGQILVLQIGRKSLLVYKIFISANRQNQSSYQVKFYYCKQIRAGPSAIQMFIVQLRGMLRPK